MQNNDDEKWIDYVNTKLKNPDLSDRDKSYHRRILRVYNMSDLSKIQWHPINMLINKIINSDFYNSFDNVIIPEVVAEWETFDLFNFPLNHVARRVSDSHFIEKSSDTKNSILLRPHTSVMWYYYLLKQWWKEKLEKSWVVKALSYGKVYRVDELDKTHHECFHQIDWLKITSKEKEIITQNTLKEVLSNTIKALFWDEVEYRFSSDSFPYTTDSLEVEVNHKGRWLEVLWAWIVHPDVLEKLWIDSSKYNGWAFGFGIERLAMAVKEIPDIRIFWSNDVRITKQWWNFESYKEVSDYPPVFKDISFLVNKDKFVVDLVDTDKNWQIELTKETESDLFDIAWIVRDISWDIIEAVELIDIFENYNKFWLYKKSVCIRITFSSLERTLTNEEINKIYFDIRSKMENELWLELR